MTPSLPAGTVVAYGVLFPATVPREMQRKQVAGFGFTIVSELSFAPTYLQVRDTPQSDWKGLLGVAVHIEAIRLEHIGPRDIFGR